MKIGKSIIPFRDDVQDVYFYLAKNVKLKARIRLYRDLFVQVYAKIYRPLNNNLYENR